MDTPEQCLKRAAQCERMAEATRGNTKKAFLAAAVEWRLLAKEIAARAQPTE